MPIFGSNPVATRIDALETRVRQLERDQVAADVERADWSRRMQKTLASIRMAASRAEKAAVDPEADSATEGDLEAILKHRGRNGR